MNNFLLDIQKSLANNRIGLVFDRLNAALREFNPPGSASHEKDELVREVTLLCVRWQRILDEALKGVKSDMELNRLAESIIDLIINVEKRFPEFYKYTEKIIDELTEEDLWLKASKENKVEGYQKYLRLYPDGQFYDQAKHITRSIKLEGKKETTLSGCILYAKVRGYVSIESYKQRDQINKILEEELFQKYLEPDSGINLVFFTGGSFALFFEQNNRDALICFKAFLFGIYTQLVAEKNNFKIGIALRWEEQLKFKYDKNYVSLYGLAIDYAKMYMSFSEKEHFFISTRVIDLLWNDAYHAEKEKLNEDGNILQCLKSHKESLGIQAGDVIDNIFDDFIKLYDSLEILPNIENTFKAKKFTYFDRLKEPFDLFNFYASDKKITVGKNYIPYHWTFLEKRDNPGTTPAQKFISRLVEAEEVCIIGITNEGTKNYLLEALQKRDNRPWKDLKIVFPSYSIVENIIDEREKTDDRIAQWAAARRDLLLFLIEHLKSQTNSQATWELLEYNGNLPFIGNRLIGRTGVVRIAPILPRESAKDVYYTEILKGTMAFEQLSDAFDRICVISNPISELNVYGNWLEDRFVYRGIVKRTKLKVFEGKNLDSNYCYPVVLIALHYYSHKNGMRYSVLQERTKMNSSGDWGKYSNISGRVIDLDILRAHKDRDLINDYLGKIFDVLKDINAQKNHQKNNEKEEKEEELDEEKINEIFNKMRALDQDKFLPEGTWVQAAIRELKEELGLSVNPDRLKPQDEVPPLQRKGISLYFKIFSLEIDTTEFEGIRKQRPDTMLEKFTFKKLEEYWKNDKLNALLHNKFEDVFVPIFNELGIWKG